MTKSVFSIALLVAVGLCGCNQTGGAQIASTAARLDPTGIAGTAVDFAQSVTPERDDDSSESLKLGRIATPLRAVAAGQTGRPNLMGAIDSQMSQAQAMQNVALASTIANAAIGGVMSGGVGLLASAPSIAMQAASTGMMNAQMSAARSQVQSAMLQAEAERAASRVVPDSDRPAEARAILTVVEAAGGRTAAWTNPETGASGKVTVRSLSKGEMPAGLLCRLVAQEWKGGEGARSGSMVVCKQDGEWYDFS